MTFKRNLICLLVSTLALSIAPLSARAQMIFERAEIRIEPAPLPDADSGKEPQPPMPPREAVILDVEQRRDDALKLEYIQALNELTPGTGVMIVLQNPRTIMLPLMNVYTPVDALFIDDQGIIQQILPNVVLGEMTHSVRSRNPVRALLFLKAGQTTARAIHPKDSVVGKSFTPPPAMQE